MTQSSTDSLVERLRAYAESGFATDHKTDCAEAADLISTLERELEEARGNCVRLLTAAQEDFVLMKETAATVMSLTQRERAASIALTAMGEALKPFTCAENQRVNKLALRPDIDHWPLTEGYGITFGDIRRARSALQSEKDREGGE